MAEPAKNNDLQEYCLQYYNDKNCSNQSNCPYAHKHRYEIEAVVFLSGTDFLLGRPALPAHQRPCYFFKLGKCMYQDSCRFLHARGDSKFNNGEITTQYKPETKNQASTSMDVDAILKGARVEQEPKMANNVNGESSDSSMEEGACALVTKSWVDAPEFIPRNMPRSYAQVVHPEPPPDKPEDRKLCPYTTKEGVCINLGTCTNIHGDLCDMCQRFVLHPHSEEERKKHQQDCIKQHEKNMEHSFAIQRSKEKSCGVCFEVIMEKATGEQRFGILPNCNHCFCLTCIRKWRQARQFDSKIIRACPECRTTSDFVCPSVYWVDTKEDKEKLIEDYKKALARKDCKYFKKGEGKCPFGNKCFYMHATPDGNKVDVGPPTGRRDDERGDNGPMDVLQVMLWDFLDERDFPWQSLADDLEDLVTYFTDSDESDWSDYELFLD